jgi:hypothetical protein
MGATANVSYVRPEVTEMLSRWDLIRDCLSGEPAIKVAGQKYLPVPNSDDDSADNLKRYRQYVERGVFYNATGRTHWGLVGQVFQRKPQIEVPRSISWLAGDIDGSGVGIAQQAKKTLGSVLAYGRCGLLADYPALAEPASRADVQSGKVRPSVLPYSPWSITNWRTIGIGGRQLLALVVLNESAQVVDDGFETKYTDQWRVLRLVNGLYQVTLYTRDPEGKLTETNYQPKDASGKPFDFIPFTFVGALNNDPSVDLPPLYDLASLNIGHWRNSCDWEDSCFMCGQPTPVISGLTTTWAEKILKNKLRLGSRGYLPLPENCTATLLQANPNVLPKEAMAIKERQMIALGARLVEQQQVTRTLGEAKLEMSTEISVLGSCAENVNAAYNTALGWACRFAGETGAVTFKIHPEFELMRMTPQERAQLIAEWQGKAITFTEMRDGLRKADIATQPDDVAKEEIASEPDYGGGAAGADLIAKKSATDADAAAALLAANAKQTETTPPK